MKHGVRPSRKEYNLIKSAGLNTENWLVVKNTPEVLELVHRHSDKTTRTIHKEVYK